jgi:hypothetical protein
MHAISVVGAVAIVCAIGVPTLWFTQAADAHPPELRDMTAIEASIAMRKPAQPNQPQKQYRPPDAPVKPVGVSHDEKKIPPPEKKKDEEKPKKPDEKPVTKPDQTLITSPSDLPTGPTTKPTIGDFNGDAKGYADISTGDPWLGKLNGDLNFSPPEIAKGDSVPVGCIHLTAEGTIVDTKWDVKTDDDVQIAADAAIAGLKKLRNDHPDPVPDRLLPLTTKWLCFKFSIAK